MKVGFTSATAFSEDRTSVAAATIGCNASSVTVGLLSTTVHPRARAAGERSSLLEAGFTGHLHPSQLAHLTTGKAHRLSWWPGG